MNLSELKEVVRKYESGIFYGDRAIQLADQVSVLISLLERAKEMLLYVDWPNVTPRVFEEYEQLLKELE